MIPRLLFNLITRYDEGYVSIFEIMCLYMSKDLMIYKLQK